MSTEEYLSGVDMDNEFERPMWDKEIDEENN